MSELTAADQAAAAEQPPQRGRRELAARGVLINSAFTIAFGAMNLLKLVVAAAFLSTGDYAIWGIVLLALALTVLVKIAAVGDKYIQQEEIDQEAAFQKAFTLELLFAGLMMAATLLAAPLLALAYGEWELVGAMLIAALIFPGLALQSPSWVYYRRMDFLRQRLVLAADPLISFPVTIGLAIAGAGYWSLIAGVIAGAWGGGLVATVMSPYRLALRYDRGTVRQYFDFSWPLMLAAGTGVLMGQISLLLGDLAIGIGAAGAIGLAASFTGYTDSVDKVITSTLYPAICRVREQRDLLLETFTKSNRLTLMWGMPFGVGLSLFAADLVDFGLGDDWSQAILLLQVFGVAAAINHVGFNWDAFYRATGQTRPIAVVAGATLLTLCAVAGPLIFVIDLDGYAIGLVAMTVVSLSLRCYYLLRLFPLFAVVTHTLRAMAPTAVGAAALLLVRVAESGERTLGIALGELGGYLLIVTALTLALERPLLREALGYLRRHRPQAALA